MGPFIKRAIVTLSLALAVSFVAVTYQGRVIGEADLAEMLSRLDALADRMEDLDVPALPTPKPSPERLDPDQRYRVDLNGWSRGPSDAAVVIVEYVDLQCPYCKRAQTTLDELQRRYPADVRLVFKHNPLPFHKDARGAARTLHCAGEQDRFWPTQDLLWTNVRALGENDLRAYAQKAELDMDLLDACLTSNRPDMNIDEDAAEAKALLARGTPTFFINGRPLIGAQPIDRFEVLVKSELESASARLLRDARWPALIMDEEGVEPGAR